jgi:hypothetical protein
LVSLSVPERLLSLLRDRSRVIIWGQRLLSWQIW